jgi:3-deoxy-D-manno-octulosonate 8-phosphate phosphatase (KDO 8-P phosphatase)
MSKLIGLDQIKAFGIDVDGTLTDGLYTTYEDGKISKSFNTRDFYAMSRLIKAGIDVVIVTGADDDVIDHKIASSGTKGIHLIKDCQNKIVGFGDWLISREWTLENAGFIGDAENDLEVMDAVRWSGCPRDAIPEVQNLSYYVSEFDGGRAAVHDCIRKFFSKLNWPWVTENYVC